MFNQQGGNNIFNQNNQNKPNPFMSNNTNQGGNIFNNNQANQNQGGNIFNNAGQTQGNNVFNNQQQNQGNIFANKGNQPTNNIFAQNQNQGNNNMMNQNQGNNMFNQGNNIFNQGQNNQGNMMNTQNPQGNNIFNNTNTGGNNMFNNNRQGGGNNIFSNNNTQGQGNNIFAQNQGNQQQGNNIFNTQGNNIFNNQGNNNQGNNIFTNQGQGQSNNIFNQNRTNQPVGGGNIFNQGQNQNPLFNTGNIQVNQMNQGRFLNAHEIEQNKLQIQEYNRKIEVRNLQILRLDDMNIYKQNKVGNMPELKQQIMILLNNMKELKNYNEQIKKQNLELDKKAAEYCKLVHQKLMDYKECLIQNIAQSNMVQDVKKQLQSMEAQVNGFLVPLYNAYKSNKTISLEDPDQFCVNINRQILKRMTILNSKVDDIIACQNQDDMLSMENGDTINVIEQLLEYYQNVCCKVRQFSQKYDHMKRRQIQRKKKGSTSYADIMKRIQDKVQNSLRKDFRCYDLLKQIETILEKREKAENQEQVSRRQAIERVSYY